MREGNLLAWNVWYDTPTLANTDEYLAHAKKWHLSESKFSEEDDASPDPSIKTTQGNPNDPDFDGGNNMYYYDATLFKPKFAIIRETFFLVKFLLKFFVFPPFYKLWKQIEKIFKFTSKVYDVYK